MEMRRVRRRIPGRTDIADRVTLRDAHALPDAPPECIEMGVVVDEALLRPRDVEAQPAPRARVDLGEGTFIRGEHRRSSRREDVDRIVLAAAAPVRER